jgi:hypothetical protein
MAVRMAALNRLKNRQLFARKAIPVDVRDAYEHRYNVRWEAQLKAARSHIEARGQNASQRVAG